jgi:hypothetical protein
MIVNGKTRSKNASAREKGKTDVIPARISLIAAPGY